MRYRSDTDLVLRGVDLSIKPGEKVRTDKHETDKHGPLSKNR
jgi:hypothetical protein